MPRLLPIFRFPRFFLWLMRVFAFGFFAGFGFGGQAQVSVFDWVVNINDVGFDPISAGGTVEYVIEVDNNTLLTVPATTVSLDVPANTRLTAIGGDFVNCTVGSNPLVLPLLTGGGGQTVMCDVPSLTSLAQAVGTVELVALQLGVIELTANVSVTGDLDADNNIRTEETTVRAGSDLQLSLLADAAADVGDFVDFDISVLNNGPDAANSFTIEFPIPTGVSNITGAGGGLLPTGCSISAGTVRCAVTGPLASTNAIGRSFRGLVTAASGSTITSTASVLDASPNDPISGNNTQTANTVVGDGTDVSIDLTRPGTVPLVTGQMVRFTLTSSYTGNAPTDLTIETTIPVEFTLDMVSSPDGWICGPLSAARVLSCTRLDPSGQGIDAPLGSIFIDTTVGTGGPATISTAISIGAVPVETNFVNNADSLVEQIVAPLVDLRANKSGPDPALGVVGNTYRYRISATNIGTAGFVGTIRMVDDLPEGLSVAAIQENGWSCSPNTSVVGPQAIICERTYLASAPLEAGETTPLVTLNALVTPAASGSLVNSLTVTEPAFNIEDTNRPNNTTSFTITTQGTTADVGANQYVALPSLAAGEIQTVFIEAFNLGPSTSENIRTTSTLSDLINNAVGPTNAGFISTTITPGVAVDPSCISLPSGTTGRSVACTISALPPCAPGTPGAQGFPPTGGTCPIFEVQFRPSGEPEQRTNSALVRSLTTPDPNLSNARANIVFEIEGRADVTVAKNITPDPAVAGQDVTYVVTASNLASGGQISTASNVTITDDLPDNVRFIAATPSAGSCGTQPAANALTSSNQVICNLGDLDSGAQATVTIVVRPTNITRGTVLRNDVAVTTTTSEADTGNNMAFVQGPVQPPVLDLLINKDDSVDPVLVGQTTTYTLTVTNAGPSASENVVVTDVLPDAIFAYRSHTVSGNGTCGTVPITQVTPTPNAADRTLECSFPSLPVDASETIQVVMEAVAQGTIDNTVTISSDEIVAGFDTEDDNNMTSETTTARQRADISVVSKTPNTPTVSLREGFTYDILVVNNPDLPGFEAENATLLDTLPTGMVLTGPPTAVVNTGTTTLNSCTGALNDTTFQCNFGTASADARIIVTVPAKVVTMTTAGQMFTNTARITTTSFDGNPNNNEAMGTVTVNASSLAGTLYRDLNNSATSTVSGQDPGDLGISGVTITLTGPAVDGITITETAITDGNGDYSFPFLPAGTYMVTRGTVGLAGFGPGQNTIGSENGTLPSQSVIADIPLTAGTAATDYDFAEIPTNSTPAIALIKTANVAALSSPPQAGQLVTYNFQITNTGSVPLTNVTLVDTVANVTLTGTPIPTLAPGETNTNAYSATYPLQPGDIGGQISNTATVTGTPPVGGDVSDISGTSFTNDTPTTTNIPNFTPAPAISLNKTVDDSATQNGGDVGDVLTYGFVVTNTGNVPLFDVTVTDSLPGIVLTGTPIPALSPGQSNSIAYTATYTLTQADVTAGQVVNAARVTGTYPLNSTQTVTDTDSETVTYEPQDIDAIPETFPPFTDGGTTTTMLASDRYNGEPATLDNVTLTVLREDDGVTLDPVTTLITLAPGLPAGTYEVDYRICAIDLPDLCDEATEVVVQAANPGVETTKTQEFVDNGDTVEGEGDTIVYVITVENNGNIALENVTVLDQLQDGQGFGLVLTTGPSFISASAGSPEGTLAPGEMATYSATFLVNAQAVNAGGVSNTVDAGGIPVTIPGVPDNTDPVRDISDDGDDSDGNTQDDPTVFTLVAPPVSGAVIDNLTLTKTTTSDVVRRGDAVPYTITVQNNEDLPTSVFNIEDTLPTGFVYVPGSASIVPSEVQGGTITWAGIQLPALSTIEITLSARILTTVRAGDHINRANVLNPATGAQLVDEETAMVRIVPEAVFDCGEVIGKVFTDLNGDGYQNAPGRENGITDQSYAGGKGGKGTTAPLPQTEKGIPNVRLVTVDGLIITTDEHGRYSVPCAALPEDRGSNFILKLDTRSLPSGYRVTTENPRVVRLTPGMMSELNFGATIGRVVRVDLDASAFGMTETGNVALSAPLKAGIAQLLPQIAGEAVNLRLTFHVPGNADAAYVKSARQMLRAADKHIKREWRKVGRTRLLIEHAIARVGQ